MTSLVDAPPTANYRQWNDRPKAVGALNEAVVVWWPGGLVAYELYKLERARSELYIYDLAVTQSHHKVDAKRRQELLRHLDQIENTVVKIVVPLAFADLFYALRGHISAVRESLLADLVLVDPSDSERIS